MPSLTITGHAGVPSGGGDQYAVPVLGPRTESQYLEIGGLSVQSQATEDGTTIVRLAADVDCAIAIGADPEAHVDGDIVMYAKTAESFSIKPGQKIAVIERPVS